VRRRAPGILALGAAVACVVAWLADALVLPHLYPAMHAALGAVTLLAAAVARCQADAALVHGALAEGATVVCSHGPRMFELLGDKLHGTDPVLIAARRGVVLFAEPMPGIGGRATKTRLSRLGARVEAAFMVPVLVDGRLLALIELGRLKPFCGRDVAGVEEIVDALVAKIQRSGWSLEWRPAPIRAS
jgi:hypothetical protein